MVAHSREHVADLVKRYLREDTEVGPRLQVVDDEVRLGDPKAEWWWVPVAFQADPFKLYYYYQLFSEVEEKLMENDQVNVLIVPLVEDPAEIGSMNPGQNNV